MNNFILKIVCILLISSTIRSQADGYYWSIDSDISSNTTTYNMWIEKSIAELMILLDQETLNNKSLIERENCPSIKKSFNNYNEVVSGNTYQAFLSIINKNPLLKKCPPTLWQSNKDQKNIAQTYQDSIILNSKYDKAPDVEKLFTLLHEMTHYLYNDSKHIQSMKNHNKNYLADLAQDTEIRLILQKNTKPIQQEIMRFMEWRADTEALKQIQCSCCAKELYIIQQLAEEVAIEAYIKPLSLMKNEELKIPQGFYYPTGYLLSWQYESTIKELDKNNTICLHHYFNNEVADLSKNDESSLADRLIIIEKEIN